MSTIKVNKIENTATSNGGVEIDNTGHVQIDGVQMPTAGGLSRRNLVRNGAMQVSQRGTSTTGVNSDSYPACDGYRFRAFVGTWTCSQSTDAPDGFGSSLKLDCTTAGTIADNSWMWLDTAIEARDLQQVISSGTTSHPLTVSFWVKSNKTGTGTFELYAEDPSTARIFTAPYTISSANTWERKEIAVPSDTSAVFDNDNGPGLQVIWWLNSGSNYIGSGHDSNWKNLDHSARNNTNIDLGESTDDEFYLTGVQIEIGDKATPFEHRPYAEELDQCKRYYQRVEYPADGMISLGYSWTSAVAMADMQFEKEMRATPTITLPTAGSNSGNVSFLTGTANTPSTIGSHSVYQATKWHYSFKATGYSGLTNDSATWLYPYGTQAVFEYSSELL